MTIIGLARGFPAAVSPEVVPGLGFKVFFQQVVVALHQVPGILAAGMFTERDLGDAVAAVRPAFETHVNGRHIVFHGQGGRRRHRGGLTVHE